MENIPQHPGMELRQIISELQISPTQLAKEVDVSASRINQIVNGKRSITVDTAIRLGRVLTRNAQYWLQRQMEYDLFTAQHTDNRGFYE